MYSTLGLGKHQIYGHIRCKYTILASSTNKAELWKAHQICSADCMGKLGKFDLSNWISSELIASEMICIRGGKLKWPQSLWSQTRNEEL